MTRAERRAIRAKRLRMEFKRRLPWSMTVVGFGKFGGGRWTEAEAIEQAWKFARIAVKTPKRADCECCSHQRRRFGPPRSDIKRLWLDVDPEAA
jgi:hypothetical protein